MENARPTSIVEVQGSQNVKSVGGGATVFAKQAARVARFYENVCGMAVTSREQDFIVLQNGVLQLVVVQIPDRIASAIHIATPPVRREESAVKLVFVVECIAGARTQAGQLGGVIDGAEREWDFQDTRVCDGHDPEGNVIQIRERKERFGEPRP